MIHLTESGIALLVIVALICLATVVLEWWNRRNIDDDLDMDDLDYLGIDRGRFLGGRR